MSYRRHVHLLDESHDLELKTQLIMLFNQLVLSAPDLPTKTKLKDLISRRLGLENILSSQLSLEDSALIEQLEIYSQVFGSRIKGSWEDAEMNLLRCRNMTDGWKQAITFRTYHTCTLESIIDFYAHNSRYCIFMMAGPWPTERHACTSLLIDFSYVLASTIPCLTPPAAARICDGRRRRLIWNFLCRARPRDDDFKA